MLQDHSEEARKKFSYFKMNAGLLHSPIVMEAAMKLWEDSCVSERDSCIHYDIAMGKVKRKTWVLSIGSLGLRGFMMM